MPTVASPQASLEYRASDGTADAYRRTGRADRVGTEDGLKQKKIPIDIAKNPEVPAKMSASGLGLRLLPQSLPDALKMFDAKAAASWLGAELVGLLSACGARTSDSSATSATRKRQASCSGLIEFAAHEAATSRTQICKCTAD